MTAVSSNMPPAAVLQAAYLSLRLNKQKEPVPDRALSRLDAFCLPPFIGTACVQSRAIVRMLLENVAVTVLWVAVCFTGYLVGPRLMRRLQCAFSSTSGR